MELKLTEFDSEKLLEEYKELSLELEKRAKILKILGVDVPRVQAARKRNPSIQSKTDVVRKAIQAVTKNDPEVTNKNVSEFIAKNYPKVKLPRTQVSSILSKLKVAEELEQVSVGIGGKSSVYRIPDPSTPPLVSPSTRFSNIGVEKSLRQLIDENGKMKLAELFEKYQIQGGGATKDSVQSTLCRCDQFTNEDGYWF